MPSRASFLSERFGPRRPCVVVNPGGGAAAPRASWLQPSGENNFPCFFTAFGAFLAGQILFAIRLSTALRPQAVQPARPRRPDHNKDAMGANLVQPKGNFIMANIGTFTADKDGFSGTLRTLTLNVKVKLVPNDKGDKENALTSASRRLVTTSAQRGRRSAKPGASTCP